MHVQRVLRSGGAEARARRTGAGEEQLQFRAPGAFRFVSRRAATGTWIALAGRCRLESRGGGDATLLLSVQQRAEGATREAAAAPGAGSRVAGAFVRAALRGEGESFAAVEWESGAEGAGMGASGAALGAEYVNAC